VNRRNFWAILAAGAGLATLSAPASASLNDQFGCETGDDRLIHVTIMITDPGTALLSRRANSAMPEQRAVLKGDPPGRAFRFDGKAARFMGSDLTGFLYVEDEQFVCRLPLPEEEARGTHAETGLPSVLVDGDGVFVRRYDIGADVPLPFGTPRSDVVTFLSRYLGTPDAPSHNSECGVGPMDFRRFDDLELNFQNGAFVGWSLRRSSDIAGSVRTSLSDGTRQGDPATFVTTRLAAVAESSLGSEYHANGVTALIDEASGTIEMLMGGANCVFR
jgi:hypothetical protein